MSFPDRRIPVLLVCGLGRQTQIVRQSTILLIAHLKEKSKEIWCSVDGLLAVGWPGEFEQKAEGSRLVEAGGW